MTIIKWNDNKIPGNLILWIGKILGLKGRMKRTKNLKKKERKRKRKRKISWEILKMKILFFDNT